MSFPDVCGWSYIIFCVETSYYFLSFGVQMDANQAILVFVTGVLPFSLPINVEFCLGMKLISVL